MLRSLALTSILAGQTLHAAAQRDDVDNSNLDPLRFNEDGTFQICVFSDLHFAQDASSIGPEKDAKSVQVMSDVLDAESPDLVVLNGDLINGESTYSHNSTHYIDQIVAPMVDRNLTWAST
jgi:metallophosphoesterase superfamily enzyme